MSAIPSVTVSSSVSIGSLFYQNTPLSFSSPSQMEESDSINLVNSLEENFRASLTLGIDDSGEEIPGQGIGDVIILLMEIAQKETTFTGQEKRVWVETVFYQLLAKIWGSDSRRPPIRVIIEHSIGSLIDHIKAEFKSPNYGATEEVLERVIDPSSETIKAFVLCKHGAQFAAEFPKYMHAYNLTPMLVQVLKHIPICQVDPLNTGTAKKTHQRVILEIVTEIIDKTINNLASPQASPPLRETPTLTRRRSSINPDAIVKSGNLEAMKRLIPPFLFILYQISDIRPHLERIERTPSPLEIETLQSPHGCAAFRNCCSIM